MQALQATNLAVRFVLELLAVAALAYWGLRSGLAVAPRIVTAVGAPVAVVVFWGLVAAPHAPVALPGPAKVAVQLLVFAIAAAALAVAHRPVWGMALFTAAVLNAALLLWWRQ